MNNIYAKNKVFAIIIATLLIIILIFALIKISTSAYHTIAYKNGSIEYLTSGALKNEIISPYGKYTIKAYVNTPALSTSTTRCELIDNESGEQKNIYWDYRQENTDIIWESETVVIINGHKLDVLTEIYDWRDDPNSIQNLYLKELYPERYANP